MQNATAAAVNATCLSSSLSGAGVIVCTIFSVIFYFVAFFVMSVAVGESRANIVAPSANTVIAKCALCYVFLRDTAAGICFCFTGLMTSRSGGAQDDVEESPATAPVRRSAMPFPASGGGSNSMLEQEGGGTLPAGSHRNRMARVAARGGAASAVPTRGQFQVLPSSPDLAEEQRSAD